MGHCLVNLDYNYIHKFETHIQINKDDSFNSGRRLNLNISEPFVCKLD